MRAYFASLGHNLRRLAAIPGRESQIQFWPYTITVYGLATLASMSITMVPIMNSVVRVIQQIQDASARGDSDPFAEGMFYKQPDLLPDFNDLMIPIALVNAVTVLLLAAAVARRLHDKDRSGLWGLMPLPFMLAGLALMPVTMPNFMMPQEPNPLIALGMLNNLVYFGVFILLIVMLVGEGTRGPNRFGPEVGAAPGSDWQ